MSATATPPQARLPSPSSAAADVARDALVLLRTGRVAMATRLLETLPDMIATELIERTGQAGLEGHRRGFNALKAAILEDMPPIRPRPVSTDWLRACCRDRATTRKAAAALRLDLNTFGRLLVDGLELSRGQRRRLREALGPPITNPYCGNITP